MPNTMEKRIALCDINSCTVCKNKNKPELRTVCGTERLQRLGEFRSQVTLYHELHDKYDHEFIKYRHNDIHRTY